LAAQQGVTEQTWPAAMQMTPQGTSKDAIIPGYRDEQRNNGDCLRERVLAIVSFIAQYFLDDRDMMTESDLVEELLSVGFEAEEIDAAFIWMESQALCAPSGSETSLNAPALSHRVFSTEENRTLSSEARGFLTRLRTMGILDDLIQEEVIEKALLMADDEITLKEIKTITVLTMFANSQNEWRREFDCLLEDDWQRLLN
jgi:Smg protein